MTETPAESPRIVVGVDPSESSQNALRWAHDIGVQLGAELDLVHAWTWPVMLLPADIGVFSLPPQPDMEASAVAVINDLVETVFGDDHDGPPIRAHVAEASPAELILDTAKDADLVVVGTNGHNAMMSALVGSVSRQVAHHSTCPVAVIRSAPAEPTGRIVVGVDGSDDSVIALQWAINAAARVDGEVHVVESWQYPALQTAAMSIGNTLPPADLMNDATAEQLATILSGVEVPENVSLSSEVREGSAAHVLLDTAKGADMLVLGTRGSGGFRGLLMGSVANRCLAHSPVPLVIVPLANG